MNTASKTEWRTRLRAGRHSLATPEAAAGLARSALDWLDSLEKHDAASHLLQPASPAAVRSVCAYVSVGQEPPTAAMLEALVAAGYRVFVPVCEADFQLTWAGWTTEAKMRRSTLAPVMEVEGPRVPFSRLPSVAAVLIPALAVDGNGVRLGQGGGYYDRFLAQVGTIPVAAVTYASEVMAPGVLPHDDLDAAVGHSVTPAGHRTL